MDDYKADAVSGMIKPPEMPPGRGMTDEVRVAGVLSARLSDVSATFRAVSSVAPAAMQEAIVAADPALKKVSAAVLYACAHDDEPVGPRIGVMGLPKTTLKALCSYEIERRSVERERVRKIELMVMTAIVGAVVGAFATWFFG